MFGSSKRQEQRQRDERAAYLEREARAEDRRAIQHGHWAVDEMKEGRPGHSRMWANHADRNAREADRLWREADEVRSGKRK